MPWFIQRKRKSEDSEHRNDGPLPTRKPSFLRTGTLSDITYRANKTIGWRLRDAAGFLERKLGPYLKKIFPNFVSVHYFYIVFMSFLASVILYAERNVSYIDALFIGACASTQAGLNPVNINDLRLYQQIIIYVFCTLTTPIFIHSSLAFLRLYWFERHFDNIRQTSKLNFKMRRTATLAARTQSMDGHRTMENNFINRAQRSTMTTDHLHSGDLDHRNDSPIMEEQNTPPTKQSNDSSSSDTLPRNNKNRDLEVMSYSNGVEHISEPSSSDNDDYCTSRAVTEHLNSNDTNGNIKFAELPKPTKHIVEPRDVMMSVSMLRNNQKQQKQEEEQGPALVIDGPRERENQGIIQFDIKKPKKSLSRRKRSGLPRSTSLFNRTNRSSNGDFSDADAEADDEGDTEHDAAILSSENDQADAEHNFENDNELSQVERSHSHLQLPSVDKTGGLKFGKRSNTLDVLRNAGSSLLPRAPTFENFGHRRPSKLFRRRFSSNAVSDNSVAIEDSETETDDDEDAADMGLRRQMSAAYLSWNPKIGRNSTFVDLSDRQKEELGGVEYRSIKLLTRVLVCYYVGFHILGVVFFVPWIIGTRNYQAPVNESGVTLTWWGFFTSMSSFNDLGYTLTPNSMMSFNTSPYALLVSAFFIVIGNTGFPILLRFIIWMMFKLSRDLSLLKESLGFLLDHPRRCFTLLFPSSPTWWLLFILVTLNIVDLVLFIILDLGAAVLEGLSTGTKVLDGFYQAVSTRTAGFACVNLAMLHPSVQVSYMVMMYISVLPLAISIRRTNVYEEQSLGVYIGGSKQFADHEEDEEREGTSDKAKPTSFIGAHLRKQLSFDLWFVFLGLFIICIAEGSKIQDALLPEFNVFQIMFEVVSAYGTVGLSLGYTGSDASFSAQFSTVSKLVVVAMVIRGRHRGLPYSLDRAIMLPSEKMELRDKYQDMHVGQRLSRSETLGSSNDPVFEFFKSAAPKVFRENIRKPSFFSRMSTSENNFNYRTGSASARVHEDLQEIPRDIDEVMDSPTPYENNHIHFATAPVFSTTMSHKSTVNNDEASASPKSEVPPAVPEIKVYPNEAEKGEAIELDYFTSTHHE